MQEVLLIALVVLLFFGGRKIPELMKGIGKGVRSFKEGMNGMEKEISPENTDKKEESHGKGRQNGRLELLGALGRAADGDC